MELISTSLIFLILHNLLFTIISAEIKNNCKFSTELVADQKYNISNTNIDENNNSTICTWNLKTEADFIINLSCSLNFTLSPNCSGNKLLISSNNKIGNNNQFFKAPIYCGNETFSLSSKENKISIGFHRQNTQQTGNFTCTAEAVGNLNFRNLNPLERIMNCDCGWRQMDRIAGGVETAVHEFEFMAALIDRNNLKCGASIISSRFILTAAHCVMSTNAYDLYVLVGDHNIATGSDTSQSQLYAINAYEIHPQFDPVSYNNDISIVQSSTQIEFNEYIGPICLPFNYINQDFVGQTVLIMGWGQLYFNGPTSDTLQKAEVQVLSTTDCRSKSIDRNITHKEICTYSSQGIDSCQYDSGGPVVYLDPSSERYQLIGIISRGVPCEVDGAGINTRVTEYLEWIVQRTQANYCHI